MPRIAWVIGLFQIGHHLANHPVQGIDHTGIIRIGLSGHARVDGARIRRKIKTHFLTIKLQTFAVACPERAVHVKGTIVHEKGAVLILIHKTKHHIEWLIKGTSILVELIRIAWIIGRKVRDTVGAHLCPGTRPVVFDAVFGSPQIRIVTNFPLSHHLGMPEIKALIRREGIACGLAARMPFADVSRHITGILQNLGNSRFLHRKTIDVIRSEMRNRLGDGAWDPPTHDMIDPSINRILTAQE